MYAIWSVCLNTLQYLTLQNSHVSILVRTTCTFLGIEIFRSANENEAASDSMPQATLVSPGLMLMVSPYCRSAKFTFKQWNKKTIVTFMIV